MSTSSAEILCSRCGTPFAIERGKPAVTCVVCGQLRPDLDLDLDEDDEDLASGLGVGAAGASIKPTDPIAHEEPVPQPTHVVMSPSINTDAEGQMPFRLDTNYVPMSEAPEGMPGPNAPTDSLAERIGPILLIVAPLASGMGGAMSMLSKVEDFSKGSWYAVGTVFLSLLLGTLVGGLVCTGVLYGIRVRWTFLLRCIYLAVAVMVTYYGITEFPSHIQVREDDFPGIVLRR